METEGILEQQQKRQKIFQIWQRKWNCTSRYSITPRGYAQWDSHSQIQIAKKGTTEDEMAGWHHWLDVHESEWTPGVGDGQGGLACCNSWGHKELDTIEWLNWTELLFSIVAVPNYFPTNSIGGFPLLHTPSPALVTLYISDDDHSEQCEVIHHCSFDLHFSNN